LRIGTAFPVVFWDVLGQRGHPIRATVSDLGPPLLSRLLQLNDTQEGVLNLTFKIADDAGLRCWTSRICARCCSSEWTSRYFAAGGV
jgi:Bacterial protein of unknown function (DUF853)